MLIMRKEGKLIACNDGRKEKYLVDIGKNGKKFVKIESVSDTRLNIASGNSKTGEHTVNFNFAIEYTCDHRCECYTACKCYAQNGCYQFSENQAMYSENVKFFMNATDEEMLQAFEMALKMFGFLKWRYFTTGDIPNARFLNIMVKFALKHPEVEFWSYTKKYPIVNKWIDENGELPANLTIIFSHWMNEDGTYFPMENPHNLPTSEFIPIGREDLKNKVTHVCPCSDPTVIATCETCDYPCYRLKKGESMGLLEHSTKETKARDKEIREAKKALKK